MKKDTKIQIIDTLRDSNKVVLFNGELYFNSKEGWKSLSNDELHLYRDILVKFEKDGWLAKDIEDVEKTLIKQVKPISIKGGTTIYTPDFKFDVMKDIWAAEQTEYDKEKIKLSIAHNPATDMTELKWWDDMLNTAFQGDQDAIKAYYEMLGLSMIPDKRHEVSYWITGPGGTGKSTIIGSVVEGLHLYRNTSHLEPSDWSSSSYVFHQMANKLVNISTDNTNNKKLETGIFKKLASGEIVVANIKYKQPIQFNNTALLISVGNEMPVITEHTSGPFRRMIALPMTVKVAEETKNKNIKDEIRSNKDNVLGYITAKAIDAVSNLYKRGEPTIPKVSNAFMKEHKLDNDTVMQWLHEEKDTKIDREITHGSFVEGSYGATWNEMFITFNLWAKANNYQVIGKRKFIERFRFIINEGEDLGIEIYSRNNKEYIVKKGAKHEND